MMDNQDAARSYREEIEVALGTDQTSLGQVFEVMRQDEERSAQSIAEKLGWNTLGRVYGAQSSIATLLEGRRIAGGTSYTAQKASMLRGFSKRHLGILSETTRQTLLNLADEHDRFASNEGIIARENEEIERAFESDDSLNVPGISVYTYPHYYSRPVLPSEEGSTDDDRTYLKVGVTESELGASKRIQQQIREVKTALPEPPLILRIYNGDDVNLKKVETKIQSHLQAADHRRINKQGEGVGTEWFLTHLKFLDSTADLLGLEVKYRHQDGEEG